jgi:long-chain acyl-CoA synthetase
MAPDPEGLLGRLHAVASTRGSATAIRGGEAEWSYAQLLDEVDGLVGRVVSTAPAPGARIGLVCANRAEFVAAFFAILGAGGVVVPLNPALQERELAASLRAAGASRVVTTRSLHARCLAALRAAGDGDAAAVVALEDEGRRGLPRARPPAGGDPAVCLFSSGSTGSPKRVERSHAQLLWEADTLITAFGLGPHDRVLGVTPFSHVNGLMRSMVAAVLAGATLVPRPQFDRRGVGREIAKGGITVFIGVPFMFGMLADTRWPRPMTFPTLRVCVSASAPLRPDTSRRFHERYGVYVRQLYGTTETGSIGANLDGAIEASLESVGRPFPGVDVRVTQESGETVPDGESGEILVRSPGGAREYAGDPEQSRRAFADGWFRTGDIGYRDARGHLHLVGRRSLFINRAGYKVNPYEVEEILAQHPKVREAAVMGVDAEYGDEKVRAVLVVRAPCESGEIVEFCRGRLADFKVPSIVEFRDALPKSATGKILRTTL